MQISELKPDPIEFDTDKKWAIILIRYIDVNGQEMRTTQFLDIVGSHAQARSYIKTIHRKGNEYFITKGWCMG